MTEHSYSEYELTLAPGETQRREVFGDMVRLLAASAPVGIRLGNGGELTGRAGYWWRAAPGAGFQSVTVRNVEGFPVTVRFSVGGGDWGDDSLVVSSVVRTAEARITTVNVGSVEQDDLQPFDVEIVPYRHNRKSITIRNTSPDYFCRINRRNIDFTDEATVTVNPDGTVTQTTGLGPAGFYNGLYLGPLERVTLDIPLALSLSPFDTDPAQGNALVTVEYWEEVY